MIRQKNTHTRRALLKSGLLAACAPFALSRVAGCSSSTNVLHRPDANGVMLPAGFSSRIVARSGQPPVSGSSFVWHGAPDGGACVRYSSAADDGWIYISNSEIGSGNGGVSALQFDARGNVVDAYSILQGTSRNCAGGLTPWNTWLSCEEVDNGQVWECDPMGLEPAVVRPALGRFKHEAVAVDPVCKRLYLTEDKRDGGWYRFTPRAYPDLSEGTLEVAQLRADSTVQWLPLDDPLAARQPTRYQADAMSVFNGGEGIVYHDGAVYFTTKGDNRIWCYQIALNKVSIVYDDDDHAKPVLTGVDNITVDAQGNLYVAEDGGDMQVVVVTAQGEIWPVAQLTGHDASEITGVAFSPDGSRLYFSSQRGIGGSHAAGMTFEICGNFQVLM